jgi:Ser/Thr protein kinase RdoA (MazF antagonist)
VLAGDEPAPPAIQGTIVRSALELWDGARVSARAWLVPAPDTTAHAEFLAFLPEACVGVVDRLEPLRLGLSGAAVFMVTTARGKYVLRVQDGKIDDRYFAQQLNVLRRAAEAGIAPAVVHVDEAARAVVLQLVAGPPLHSALADPAQRAQVLASAVDALRTLHAFEPSGVPEGDPLPYAWELWQKFRERPGVPPWAEAVPARLDAIAATLSGDGRRVVSHNDVNPGNLLWDGARVWLIDWEAAGLGHPYYDLATLALFLRLEEDVALQLVARHDGAPPNDRSVASFRVLRQLAGVLCGLTFLSLVDDLKVRHAPTRKEAPTLGECFAELRTGQLDLQSPRGQASIGLALLALGLGP